MNSRKQYLNVFLGAFPSSALGLGLQRFGWISACGALCQGSFHAGIQHRPCGELLRGGERLLAQSWGSVKQNNHYYSLPAFIGRCFHSAQRCAAQENRKQLFSMGHVPCTWWICALEPLCTMNWKALSPGVLRSVRVSLWVWVGNRYRFVSSGDAVPVTVSWRPPSVLWLLQ